MKTSFYLIVNSNGTVRTVKNRPGLDFNEVSVQVSLQLPDALFRKPQLQATITVPDESVQPIVIEPDVQNNIKDAIEQATGLEIKLTVGQ
ncbi:hypothetical protein [Larkinella terrae]|uniref:Uncharacterized protein n=1 Tax=Larkinella terrae TaxID=2025311 RepID=A0A7K0EDE3_9BACT|nr:hypothetical protein [Larkinella terrae]MRS59883.1 hypothetical protein [Larkinella terrae]